MKAYVVRQLGLPAAHQVIDWASPAEQPGHHDRSELSGRQRDRHDSDEKAADEIHDECSDVRQARVESGVDHPGEEGAKARTGTPGGEDP